MKTSGSGAANGFSRALRDAIDACGVSLVRLRNHLADLGSPVSLTTLSSVRSRFGPGVLTVRWGFDS